MLTPMKKLYLMTPPKQKTEEELKEEETKQQVVTQVTPGVKRILRVAGAEDEIEAEENVNPERPIDHISQEVMDKMYSTRMTPEEKEAVHALWKTFEGTRKYHNYTKEIKPHEAAACRYMMEMTANEFLYVN